MCQKAFWYRSGGLRGPPGMVFWRIFVEISREIDNRKLVRKLAENREPHLGQLHQQQKSWTKTSKRTGQPTRMHKFLGCGGLALAFSTIISARPEKLRYFVWKFFLKCCCGNSTEICWVIICMLKCVCVCVCWNCYLNIFVENVLEICVCWKVFLKCFCGNLIEMCWKLKLYVEMYVLKLQIKTVCWNVRPETALTNGCEW